MAERTVTVCDGPYRAREAEDRAAACDRLGPHKCAICERDYCNNHFSGELRITVTSQLENASPVFLGNEMLGLCYDCAVFCRQHGQEIDGTTKQPVVNQTLDTPALMETLIGYLKAQWAVRALAQGAGSGG